jgi:hypothetical protein
MRLWPTLCGPRRQVAVFCVLWLLALVLKERADLVAARLEEVGMAIGRRLAERLTRDRGRFASDLETVRFLCKAREHGVVLCVPHCHHLLGQVFVLLCPARSQCIW